MTNDIVDAFKVQREQEIAAQGESQELRDLTRKWFDVSCRHNYSYHFDWLSRPIIQYPQDMAALQELIWKIKPDLIVECGIAHGGSLIYNASILALIDYCRASEAGETLAPKDAKSRVLGIDIEIRPHNREAIESHPLSHKIDMIEGSSIDPDVVAQVRKYAEGFETIMVILDSNHTHDHVLGELNAYADLTSVDSYCVVLDTAIEDMPADMHANRPWGPGNNPKTAVWAFLKGNKNFEIDGSIDDKLLISVGPEGYLKRTS